MVLFWGQIRDERLGQCHLQSVLVKRGTRGWQRCALLGTLLPLVNSLGKIHTFDTSVTWGWLHAFVSIR